MPYDPRMTAPMREELTRAGFRELRTPEEVDAEVAKAEGPMLVVVNSICGCAAGIARPGILMSLSHPKAPPTRRCSVPNFHAILPASGAPSTHSIFGSISVPPIARSRAGQSR